MQIEEKCLGQQSHLLHWALCDFYLETVHLPPLFGCLNATTKRPAGTSLVDQEMVKTNVEYAISTLQDLVELKTSRLIELSTRIALAKLLIQFTQNWEQADENLRKVIKLRKISGSDRAHDRLGFEAIMLRCQLLVKRGDTNNKLEIAEYIGQQSEHDKTIQEAIDLCKINNHLEMQAIFMLMQAKFSITCNDKEQAEASIEQLKSMCQTQHGKNFQLLAMHCRYLNILHQSFCGNLRHAHELAREAAKHIYPELCDEPMMVLSGLSYLPDISTPKSKDYFENGIACIDDELDKHTLSNASCQCHGQYFHLGNDCRIHSQQFLIHIKVHLLECLMYYYLSQFQTAQAKMVLVAVKECCTSEHVTSQIKYTTQLLTAMYLQATGQFELATLEYQSLLEKKLGTNYPDKSLMVSFSIFLMQPFEQRLSDAQASTLVQSLSDYVRKNSHSADAIKCIHFLMQSLKNLETTASLLIRDLGLCRRNILDALRTSSALGNIQLKALVLTVLGLVFHATDHEQSNKMLTSSMQLNEKIQNKYAVRVIKNALEGDKIFTNQLSKQVCLG
ncbi:hypothetical protein INT43_002606 [Umbelopsis isabellina]|uniref:Uncharacterized protein n=1 Tax=Mortierella isabellina TaxID=91625 RepID=A0A8H7Q5B8_MORIS|nr:hypothetical protein INT43_002606 [Umbelopsis isabellina]